MAERIDAGRCTGFGRIRLGHREVVGEQRLGELEVAVEGLPVGIQQQLARIATVPGRGIPRAMDPVVREAIGDAQDDMSNRLSRSVFCRSSSSI